MARIDTNSDTWEVLCAFAAKECKKAHDLMERDDSGIEQVIAARARIKQARRLLDLPDAQASLSPSGPDVPFGIDAPEV